LKRIVLVLQLKMRLTPVVIATALAVVACGDNLAAAAKTKVPATTEPASLDISDSASGSSAENDALLAFLASMDLSGSDDSASAEETKAPKAKKTEETKAPKTKKTKAAALIIDSSDDSASAEETKAPKTKKTKAAALIIDSSDDSASAEETKAPMTKKTAALSPDANDLSGFMPATDLATTAPTTKPGSVTTKTGSASGSSAGETPGFWSKVKTWWKGKFGGKDEETTTTRLRQ
ncbi:hypothetical protein JM16_009801, partial [Phytophthora kernoviae]